MPAATLEAVIAPRTTHIGVLQVRRALPSAERRRIGPFVFLDQMGPQTLGAGQGVDVPPHPHIGLATITYLFDGELTHRDSLGTVQVIGAGDVNWMTAGRGIVHSERTPPERRQSAHRLFGLQAWVALPEAEEEVEPWFEHQPQQALPLVTGAGTEVRLIAGRLFGARSALRVFQDMFYADAKLNAAATLELPPEHEERAVYVVEGAVKIDGRQYGAGSLLVLRPGAAANVTAAGSLAARLMLLGGAAMETPSHMWWNFVSSSRERIERAKADWAAGRFPGIPGEAEAIPLPQGKPRPVDYP